MKNRISIIILSFLFPFFLTAQIQKGSWLIGGTLNWNHEQTFMRQSNSHTNVNISITDFEGWLGYFLTKNIAVGLGANYYQLDRKFLGHSSGDRHDNTVAYGAEFFVKTYLNSGNPRFYLTTAVAYQWQSDFIFHETAGNSSIKHKYFNVLGGIGLDVFLSKNIALNGLVRHIFYNETAEGSFQGRPDFFTSLGLLFFLNTNQQIQEEVKDSYFQKGNFVFNIRGRGDTKLTTTPYTMSFASGLKYFTSDNWRIGADIGVSFSNLLKDFPTRYSISAALNAQYFYKLTSHLYFAPQLQFRYDYSFDSFWAFTPSGRGNTKGNVFEISTLPEVYYFFSPRNLLKFGFRMSRGWSKEKTDLEFNFPTIQLNDFRLGLQTGVEFFVTKHISFELIAGWELSNANFERENVEPWKDQLSASDIRFGMNYFIQSKR